MLSLHRSPPPMSVCGPVWSHTKHHFKHHLNEISIAYRLDAIKSGPPAQGKKRYIPHQTTVPATNTAPTRRPTNLVELSQTIYTFRALFSRHRRPRNCDLTPRTASSTPDHLNRDLLAQPRTVATADGSCYINMFSWSSR